MKKIFLLAIAAFMFTTGMQAQIVRSQSATIEREKTPSNTQWYMRVGVGFAKWVGSDWETDDDESNKANIGYDFMFGFQKKFGSSDLYWGMEYGLGSRGYKLVVEDKDYDYKYTEKLMGHNIKIVPFQLGYKYTFGGTDVSIDPHISAFVSVDYTGKIKEKEEWEGDTDEEDYSISDFDDYQRVDAGLQFGVGVWFKNFNVDFTYQRGFIPVVKDYKVYNSQFMIRLGFAF
ncbi:MAG: outer membrane beta-barrel protein [Alloprevotella sp.]